MSDGSSPVHDGSVPPSSAPPGPPTPPVPPGPVARWVLGARPRTLPAAVVPVLVGTATAACGYAGDAGFVSRSMAHTPLHPGLLWWRAGGALIVALAIQVGTNFANDYSDGVRGTDDVRVGPVRLVASGLASPSRVKGAALLSFAVAGVVGLGLAAVTSWWVLAVGAACLAAGWLYTGGPHPYGYAGLRRGCSCSCSSASWPRPDRRSSRPGTWPCSRWWCRSPVGLLATALLLANNLRDIDSDRKSASGPWPCGSAGGGADGSTSAAWSWPSWAQWSWRRGARGRCWPWPPCRWPYRPVRSRCFKGTEGRALLPVLADTGRLQLAFGFLLAVGLWI